LVQGRGLNLLIHDGLILGNLNGDLNLFDPTNFCGTDSSFQAFWVNVLEVRQANASLIPCPSTTIKKAPVLTGEQVVSKHSTKNNTMHIRSGLGGQWKIGKKESDGVNISFSSAFGYRCAPKPLHVL